VREKPTGPQARRLWFLFEWLTGRTLDVADPGKVKAVPVLEGERQFALQEGHRSSRHKVIDNLPGTRAFCPLVRRTVTLDAFAARGFDGAARQVVGRTHPDVLSRAAAFLSLSDSRASFQIEGEQPAAGRVSRWGQLIAEAGAHALSLTELERLQRVGIGDARLVELGLRREGGFVGAHDRRTGEPLPEHVSARPEDLARLVEGIAAFVGRAVGGGLDAVVSAATAAFGFVYVHPFQDGNGRLHRWLIHHVLAQAGYNPSGVVFPVSAAILRDVVRYRAVLESYSRPLLPLIEWRPTPAGNVEVLNDTGDFYRYFDATLHAEFLYGCVAATVERDLPAEVRYLESYDRFRERAQSLVDMPERTLDLLHRFLQQGAGRLSVLAREGEFAALSREEVSRLEAFWAESFPGA